MRSSSSSFMRASLLAHSSEDNDCNKEASIASQSSSMVTYVGSGATSSSARGDKAPSLARGGDTWRLALGPATLMMRRVGMAGAIAEQGLGRAVGVAVREREKRIATKVSVDE